jgi:hypothetical protein
MLGKIDICAAVKTPAVIIITPPVIERPAGNPNWDFSVVVDNLAATTTVRMFLSFLFLFFYHILFDMIIIAKILAKSFVSGIFLYLYATDLAMLFKHNYQ